MALIFVMQLLLVSGAIAWLWSCRPAGRMAAAAAIGACAMFLLGAVFTGLWVYPPLWTFLLAAPAFALAARRCWRKSRDAASTTTGLILFAIPAGALALSGGVLLQQGISGRLAPTGQVVDLEPPLRGDGICAISAGSSPLLNFHYMTLQPGFDHARGQSYGVDLIALNSFGFRTRPEAWWRPAPPEPEAYAVFGREIYAPCAGVVVRSQDGIADQEAGVRSRDPMAGNHIVLRCGEHEVLLAHFRQGSVRVQTGDAVIAGAALGAVGNTGNTDEPHLHISVQLPRTPGREDGEPVHITFNGRALARGDCL